MNKLKIAYYGTPDFSAHFLDKLLQDTSLPIDVIAVVTQKDKPVGRKQVLTKTPVKKIAEQYSIPIVTDPKGADLALLYAYGELIPQDILSIPQFGFWNIHPSFLPKYRGPSPVASALIAGEKETGVTLMKLVEELDAGPIIAQKAVVIEPKERTPELSKRLAEEGYELFKKSVRELLDSPHFAEASRGKRINELKITSQNDLHATYTKRFEKQDGYIEFSNLKLQMSNSSEKLFNRFRGFYPWPGIWSLVRIKNNKLRIKIIDMDMIEGKIIIKKVQLEGKSAVDFKTFNSAYRIF